ncbi:hypothetical protein BDZ91DRAFT_753849 [Kalaharituber pfeilii]|nr:hypothetical protein BDZ91DRAFT_753849 [Kalaharituber pfeilii]
MRGRTVRFPYLPRRFSTCTQLSTPLLLTPRTLLLPTRNIVRLSAQQRRNLTNGSGGVVGLKILSLHPAIVSPLVFAGLVCSLWAYKCLMLVIFQNKIIYMPGIPLGSRQEHIEDYALANCGLQWREIRIPSTNGVVLAGAMTKIRMRTRRNPPAAGGALLNPQDIKRKKRVIIVYFQGNAASTPPRLPFLSSILSSLLSSHHSGMQLNGIDEVEEVEYTLIAPAYRGYWKSTGRPHQRGIEEDGLAVFRFLEQGGYLTSASSMGPSDCNASGGDSRPTDSGSPSDERRDQSVQLVLWGQSIGANVAMTTLANYLERRDAGMQNGRERRATKANSITDMVRTLPIPSAVILETPIMSVPRMLIELYPQKWLPYRYLTPFLRNWWEMDAAVRRIACRINQKKDQTVLCQNSDRIGKILILTAEKDEVVGKMQGDEVEETVKRWFKDMTQVRRVVVRGALHVECLTKGQGRAEVLKLLQEVSNY